MGIKIGINGFGRIGRVVMRILADDPERFDVCGRRTSTTWCIC